MGGIVMIVKTPHGERLWGGHAQDVMNFFKLKDIMAVKKGDRHNGTITFDPEEKMIIFDSDYFTPSKDVVRFWKCLGFDVLGRAPSYWEGDKAHLAHLARRDEEGPE